MIKPTKEFWDIFKSTDGALSCTEAVAIMNLAAQAPKGVYMELGVAFGKSAMASNYAFTEGRFYLVEPNFSDRDLEREVFERINSINPKVKIRTFIDYSTNVIDKYDNYSWVFVDSGSHQDGLPMQEVRLLEDRVVKDGIIAFHDWNSQFREVKEASDYLVGTGKYEYIPINWDEIIEYVNSENLEEGNQSWHHNELRNPCFVGAVRRK